MKKLNFIFVFAISGMIIFSACSTSIDDYGVQETVSKIVTKGSWGVNLYIDGSSDKTNDFSGYQFVFSNNGTVTVTANGVITEGTWSENSYNNKLLLNFNSTDPALNKINEEWLINTQNKKQIKGNSTNSGPVEELGLIQL